MNCERGFSLMEFGGGGGWGCKTTANAKVCLINRGFSNSVILVSVLEGNFEL